MEPSVKATIDGYPVAARKAIRRLRKLVYETAQAVGAGPLTETLKWGEPAFLTEASGTGTTIRMAWKAKTPDEVGVYFNCQTTLVETIRALFPDDFAFEGNRALKLELGRDIPEDALTACFEMALTYHASKKAKRKRA